MINARLCHLLPFPCIRVQSHASQSLGRGRLSKRLTVSWLIGINLVLLLNAQLRRNRAALSVLNDARECGKGNHMTVPTWSERVKNPCSTPCFRSSLVAQMKKSFCFRCTSLPLQLYTLFQGSLVDGVENREQLRPVKKLRGFNDDAGNAGGRDGPSPVPKTGRLTFLTGLSAGSLSLPCRQAFIRIT